MASAFPSQPEFKYCPLCQSLCLSPTILPCGHLVCRKCLRHILETQGPNPSCPSCKRRIPRAQGQTISELADQLGKDVILEDVVLDQLASQSDHMCVSCPNKAAIKLCVDCAETYCNNCSNAHKGMRMSKDHVQQDLPHTLLNAPQVARTRPVATTADVISSEPSQDNIRYSHDTQPRQNTDRKSLQDEASLFQTKIFELRMRAASTALEANVVQIQEIRKKLDKQQQLLATYVTRLAKPDDVLLANTRSMLPQLREIRENCQPVPQAALTTLTGDVHRLLHVTTPAGAPFDHMSSVPRKVFVSRPTSTMDQEDKVLITSMLVTRDWRLVMADFTNHSVKTADLFAMDTTVVGARLEMKPNRMALLPDGVVAVTASNNHIYFVDVSGNPTVTSQVRTARWYMGVGSMVENDNILVGCKKDENGPASVDVISRDGVVLRTIVDGNTLTDLSAPISVCFREGTIFISDALANTVFQIEADTGRVLRKLTHEDLERPHQIAVDEAGNCYIASTDKQCVLVVTPGGRWRRLLQGPDHGDATHRIPVGLCVMSFGLVVSWLDRGNAEADCVVSVYDFI